jgi:hypothetical protein
MGVMTGVFQDRDGNSYDNVTIPGTRHERQGSYRAENIPNRLRRADAGY